MGALRSIPNVVEMPRTAFDVQRAVRRTRLGNNTAKSLLLVLADYVNAQGWCYVSTQTVLYEADMELRTLQTVKRILGEMGLLEHVRLTKAEMAMLRMQGEEGAFREEEWQLNLSKLGEDLSEEYCARLDAVNGKKVKSGRGKALPGPSRAAAADAVATQNRAAATELCAAAAYPSDSLLGKNTIEHQGTPSHARGAAEGMDSRVLAGAAAVTRGACFWRGSVGQKAEAACVEVLGDLCRELVCNASEASALVIEAWELDQDSGDPTRCPLHWFGGPWRRWVDRVLARREAERRAAVGMRETQDREAAAAGDVPVAVCDAAVQESGREMFRGLMAFLERNVNRQSFATWLKPCRFLHVAAGDVLCVRVPSGMFMHLGDRYADLIQNALESMEAAHVQVRFVVAENVRES